MRHPRPGEAGFVTVAALMLIVAVTLIAVLSATNLLGETREEIAARQAAGALAVAEAGAN